MHRLIGPSLGTLLATGLLLIGSVAAVTAHDECVLEVEPAQAASGSEFVLSGTGYAPTQLILQRETAPAVTFDLDLDDTDPFEIPIGSKSGDEGLWLATVVTDDGCRGTVEFHVTLPPTDVIDELIATPAIGGLQPLLLLAIVVLGFLAGTLIGRYARLRA